MSARKPTLAERIAALTAEVAALRAERTIVAKPASAGAAESPFVKFLHERAASKVACEIHPRERCNRKFTPASSGRTNHVARVD